MTAPFPQRSPLILSTIANAYFWLQVLLFQLHARTVLVGVFTELLTIPSLIALAVSGVGLIILLVRRRLERRYRGWGALLLASTALLIALAFFV